MDVEWILNQLSIRRPVFHSEADFQFSFAWEIKKAYPEFDIRLEYPISTNHLDIFASNPEQAVLFELKYKHRPSSFIINGEEFNLCKNQPTYANYDFIKDIKRLEEFSQIIKEKHNTVKSYALLLTNDKNFWKQLGNRIVLDSEFKIYEGRILNGELNWTRNSTNENIMRRLPIYLNGTYKCVWKEYSKISAEVENNQFQYLLINV